jgi:hypothetical protein
MSVALAGFSTMRLTLPQRNRGNGNTTRSKGWRYLSTDRSQKRDPAAHVIAMIAVVEAEARRAAQLAHIACSFRSSRR